MRMQGELLGRKMRDSIPTTDPEDRLDHGRNRRSRSDLDNHRDYHLDDKFPIQPRRRLFT